MSNVVAEMEKGVSEKIVFSLSEFKGKNYADVRVYYEDGEGEWKPTKKGVTVVVDQFSEFKDHVGTLEAFLDSKGLLDG